MVNIRLEKPRLFLKKAFRFYVFHVLGAGAPDTNYNPEPFSRPVSVRLYDSLNYTGKWYRKLNSGILGRKSKKP
jgi:hypothetical protein